MASKVAHLAPKYVWSVFIVLRGREIRIDQCKQLPDTVFHMRCPIRIGAALDINFFCFIYPCSLSFPTLYSILASSAFLLPACSFNKKSLRSSLSVVQTQNQLIISTNAKAKITLLFNPSPQPWCLTAPALYLNHLGECEKDHNAIKKNVINRTGA